MGGCISLCKVTSLILISIYSGPFVAVVVGAFFGGFFFACKDLREGSTNYFPPVPLFGQARSVHSRLASQGYCGQMFLLSLIGLKSPTEELTSPDTLGLSLFS